MVNGPPKSGTHLLAALKGGPITHDPALPTDLIRNPRNILISRVRAFGGTILRQIPRMLAETEQFSPRAAVRFEDLPAAPPTATWTGRHSDWREWWTREIETAWGTRGRNLELVWGYGCNSYSVN